MERIEYKEGDMVKLVSIRGDKEEDPLVGTVNRVHTYANGEQEVEVTFNDSEDVASFDYWPTDEIELVKDEVEES